jgi:hypothetical protein
MKAIIPGHSYAFFGFSNELVDYTTQAQSVKANRSELAQWSHSDGWNYWLNRYLLLGPWIGFRISSFPSGKLLAKTSV